MKLDQDRFATGFMTRSRQVCPELGSTQVCLWVHDGLEMSLPIDESHVFGVGFGHDARNGLPVHSPEREVKDVAGFPVGVCRFQHFSVNTQLNVVVLKGENGCNKSYGYMVNMGPLR